MANVSHTTYPHPLPLDHTQHVTLDTICSSPAPLPPPQFMVVIKHGRESGMFPRDRVISCFTQWAIWLGVVTIACTFIFRRARAGRLDMFVPSWCRKFDCVKGLLEAN